MIIDLGRFVDAERPFWDELSAMLDRMERRVEWRPTPLEAKRFHYLYQRAATDLARVADFPAELELRRSLEDLVARAYAEAHETRAKPYRLRPIHWLLRTFPRTFRKHGWAFALSAAITLVGSMFGAGAMLLDPGSKAVLMPFPHLMVDPRDRVKWEENTRGDRLAGQKKSFSAMLMTHNTKVSITVLALGMTWGIGSIMLLFYNGVILGAVVADYLAAGEGTFLLGWLMPHGVIEIPAILIAGQASLVLARALIGWGSADKARARLRAVAPDLVTLIMGVGVMLVWAGVVEAFFSQYHEPALPYAAKIGFGAVELVLLALFLARSGKRTEEEAA